MKKRPMNSGLVVGLVLLLSVFLPATSLARPLTEQVQSPALVTTVREGNDFATQLLGDPWDMTEFTDISQSLNNAGRTNLLNNIQVNNGIFSASSTSLNNGQFYALFPGYEFTLRIGKVGMQYPIPSSYHCFYVRMNVSSPSTSDGWYLAWLNLKQDLSDGGDQSHGMPLQLNDGLPLGSWRIYSADINTVQSWYGHPWSSQSAWKGLSIHPTSTANTAFAVDWIRLTDCQPVNYAITWSPISGQTRLWAGIGGQQKDILVTSLQSSSSSYTWDVQGIAPGTYYIGIEANGTMTWLPDNLVVQQAPTAQFVRPSPYSGLDYATQAGHSWGMNSSSDFTQIACTTPSFSNGLLLMDTLYPALLSGNCKGSGVGEADPKMFFNVPATPFDGSQYRYLSFRMSIDGSVGEPADGMIGRWIWTVQKAGGGLCTFVSQAVPYDVGWHTYVMDLLDPVQGYPEEGTCTPLEPWSSASQVVGLRFDPNENWTGNLVPAMIFHQEFDWFRLTQVDRVARGTPFPVQIALNKPPQQVPTLNFYYTTDRQQPTQNRASAYQSSVPSPIGRFPIYLPLVLQNFDSFLPPVTNGVTFLWDTTSVQTGQYYLCVVANDGYNQTTFCSAAPVAVQ
jgi:hypothetical protein